jgi:hypothetical protein
MFMKKLALLSTVAVALAAGSIVPTVAFAATKAVVKHPAHVMKHTGKKMAMKGKAMPVKATGPKPAVDASTDQLNQQQLDQAKTK